MIRALEHIPAIGGAEDRTRSPCRSRVVARADLQYVTAALGAAETVKVLFTSSRVTLRVPMSSRAMEGMRHGVTDAPTIFSLSF
jgi:hypothetical protein